MFIFIYSFFVCVCACKSTNSLSIAFFPLTCTTPIHVRRTRIHTFTNTHKYYDVILARSLARSLSVQSLIETIKVIVIIILLGGIWFYRRFVRRFGWHKRNVQRENVKIVKTTRWINIPKSCKTECRYTNHQRQPSTSTPTATPSAAEWNGKKHSHAHEHTSRKFRKGGKIAIAQKQKY